MFFEHENGTFLAKFSKKNFTFQSFVLKIHLIIQLNSILDRNCNIFLIELKNRELYRKNLRVGPPKKWNRFFPFFIKNWEFLQKKINSATFHRIIFDFFHSFWLTRAEPQVSQSCVAVEPGLGQSSPKAQPRLSQSWVDFLRRPKFKTRCEPTAKNLHGFDSGCEWFFVFWVWWLQKFWKKPHTGSGRDPVWGFFEKRRGCIRNFFLKKTSNWVRAWPSVGFFLEFCRPPGSKSLTKLENFGKTLRIWEKLKNLRKT